MISHHGPTSPLVDDAIELAMRGGVLFPVVLLSEGIPNRHGRPLSVAKPPPVVIPIDSRPRRREEQRRATGKALGCFLQWGTRRSDHADLPHTCKLDVGHRGPCECGSCTATKPWWRRAR